MRYNFRTQMLTVNFNHVVHGCAKEVGTFNNALQPDAAAGN